MKRIRLVANARMYAVTPEAEQRWRTLLARIFADADLAGVELDYLPWPAPQPLEALWSREDLGCAFMCGYPVALGLAPVRVLAAPVPSLDFAAGRAVYRSDLIVARRSPARRLEDTFGGVAGWTVAHSQSGFNAFRHHLLGHLSPDRPRLYGRMDGGLVTAREILDRVADGRLDVGPLDAYWHALLARDRPDLTDRVRVLESTAAVPMPAFVAGPRMPAEAADRLAAAFAGAAQRPWFGDLAAGLLLDGFSAATRADYDPLLRMRDEAVAAGYPEPA